MNWGELFNELSELRVAIVGDIMLDTYWWGHVERISPEAPVPVVAFERKELRVGGAANVALNTVSMGAKTTVFSVTGDDADARQLMQLLKESNIDTSYIINSPKRITTNKTRVMSRNQQMMRLDAEMTTDIDGELEDALVEKLDTYIKEVGPNILIFEDYNKGILTEGLIARVTALCKQHGVITAVDPKRKNFLAFKGVTLFKPNLKEVREGLHLLTTGVDLAALQNMHTVLQEHLQHEISFITLSENGVFYQQGNESKQIPTHIRNIADVSGAGDTVIAVASLVYAATKKIHLAAEMANIAGGLVCEEVGTAAIDRDKLLRECEKLL